MYQADDETDRLFRSIDSSKASRECLSVGFVAGLVL
jgi:hypothetical protein